ncbi:hypothetical protein YYG_02558 [Plasmodium vinckei petteri]|uniref:Uncharacterized protein n=1 Tax=Plasmodium vinckei petteri TaxID=138298 RepID=W7AJB6_PLAVN|nr:hypothetical protein YYG_02558 [Plasmodium vinckei petteri]
MCNKFSNNDDLEDFTNYFSNENSFVKNPKEIKEPIPSTGPTQPPEQPKNNKHETSSAPASESSQIQSQDSTQSPEPTLENGQGCSDIPPKSPLDGIENQERGSYNIKYGQESKGIEPVNQGDDKGNHGDSKNDIENNTSTQVKEGEKKKLEREKMRIDQKIQ